MRMMLRPFKYHKKKKSVAMVLFVEPKFSLHPTILTSTTHTQPLSHDSTTSVDHPRTLGNILHNTDSHVDSYAYVSLLKACIQKKALWEGQLIHAHINQIGFIGNKLLQNTLLNMYVKCGSVVDARRVFDQMPQRDECSWTVMIAAYSRHGPPEEALSLFHQMPQDLQPNQFTYSSVLPACASMASLEQGMEIHQQIIRCGFHWDVVVLNALIDMYAKCGSLDKARELFDKMHQRNVVSWNTMIAGSAQHGDVDEARKLFMEMPQRNVVSWNALIVGYAQNGLIDEALELFKQMPQRNVVSWNTMIAGFTQNGFVEEALKLFNEMPHRDMTSWNAMIAGFVQNGIVDEALKLFKEMPQRNMVSWTTMIAGFAQNGLIHDALKLFQEMPQRDIFSWTAMIAGFAQNGLVDDALKLFKEMPKRTIVSWNAMIAGFAQNGHGEEALKLFKQMQLSDVGQDSKTFACILPVCANLAALQQGMEIHENIIRSGFQSEAVVVNALIDMYAKCGYILKAWELFDKMHQHTVFSWTAMIAGYAMHGCGKEALTLFEQMKHSGMRPNHVTLVSVLSACSHAGLVDEGYQYFNSMSEYYHITPAMEHYRCMVDLLGRAGQLEEAHDFINKMPIKPDATVWSCLLGACRIHNNMKLGKLVAESVLELDEKNVTAYVLLSNIYAAAGRWDNIEKVRKMMKDKGIRKTPGCSWIEINKQVHVFLVGDRSHPQLQDIYAELERLSWEMKEAGYVPNTKFVLNDVKEEEKEQIISHHSEKLAIAFGLLNTCPGEAIRVIKNLRVCGDCHTATKFISKIVAREIIVRDANRYHHFKGGECSCGDYW